MKSEKEKIAFMITWVTHNSRISDRMIHFGVRLGEPVRLTTPEEIGIMATILEIVRNDLLKILRINICRDHLHMILVCRFEERSLIVSKIKSITSRAHNISVGWTVPEAHQSQQGGMPPCSSAGRRGVTQSHLWAQKYHWKLIEVEEYLHDAMEYIRNNRIKHNLPANSDLEKIIADIITPIEEAFEFAFFFSP